MSQSKVTKTLAATLDALEPIRNFITEASTSLGLDKKKTYNLCLAVDEIATNIIIHGYQEHGVENGNVYLTITADDANLEVILEDEAVPFDPIQHALPTEEALQKSLEDRPIGGLGVMIAHKSVDKFQYEFLNNRNRNIFTVGLAN